MVERAHKYDPTRSLEIFDLDVFLCVAELASFRKASRFLNIGQSAVSRRIQKLEDTIGVSLFERSNTGARLTRAGWRFAERARAIVLDFSGAIALANADGSASNGRLYLGMIASLSAGVLRDVTADFLANHPAIELLIVEGERGDLLTRLSHRKLDAVVACGSLPVENGDSLMLMRARTYVALPAGHALSKNDYLSWNELRDEEFIVCASEPGPEIHDYLTHRLGELGRRLRVTHHRVGREGIMNLVGLGLGASLVADHWCGVSYPGVVFRPIIDDQDLVPFSITWLPDNDNPALRRFLSLSRVRAMEAMSDNSSA
ncbi:MAG: LysR family transcriptional regulator [Pseudomonadota bacterium]